MKKLITFGIIVFIGLALLGSSCTIVKSGTVGVVSRMGAVQNETFAAGLHFKAPFIVSVKRMNIQTQKVEVEASAASKDLQVIATAVAVNYHVDADTAATLYRNVGVAYEQIIISPAIQESVKAVIAQYSAEQLITRRQEVSLAIKNELSEKIGIYGIVADGFNITNLDFSPEFNAAIEAKQTAQQNALKAEQELTRITIEAQQKVEQAKAEAEATKTLADAEAYAIEIVQSQLAQNAAYIEYRKVEKWDGVLPRVQGESTAIIDMRE